MVFRVYVEKKAGLRNEAVSLYSDLKNLLGISKLTALRIINRYDVENIEEELFESSKTGIFAEPQLDNVSDKLDAENAACVFGVEPLPGQFDQRADSAAQCIQIVSKSEKPTVKTAKVYVLYGDLDENDILKIKNYVINPVECREASLELPKTLKVEYDIPVSVETLAGFNALDEKGLAGFVKKYGLAMDADDVKFCQDYFKSESREPTITEIRMIDTYWSDHCRHTTFLTTIDKVEFDDPTFEDTYREYLKAREYTGREKKPINLMDLATIGARTLKKQGLLDKLDESDEINACTVKIKVEINGKSEDWLLLFKNETHNHPTEIEPFGGAATCIGGAIRDPLSGRAYVYSAMRVTGAGDPLTPVEETIAGKLPQRKIVTTAAAGYSSYGNQIGLATGMVDEIYHDGYVAKRMEIGAVIGAAPAENVRRECPLDGDLVILLGGRTGRDGCGGATGSSKSHSVDSLSTCGAEVQKGNAPEERKLQRLFRNKDASLLIKRCNDFGAGGVSVAIGELADGLEVDLNAVPKKYDGLDGTELAISESQERMAVVVAKEDADKFIAYADKENLEATVVARVCAEPRLKMVWNGKTIVDVSRDFLNSNGAEKHTSVNLDAPRDYAKKIPADFAEGMRALAGDLNVCSKRGLSERFDSTIGAGTVLMPFGGRNQLTPIQAMANKISSERGFTDCCSLMSWGYNPFITSESPYHGAYLAVIESVSKLIASGAEFKDVYLTFQEYFEKPKNDPKRWGKPFAAVLGAFKAQLDLKIGAIGGKDSMSGTFEHIDVPPTLVSFAVTTDKASDVVSPEFKAAGHIVALIRTKYNENGLPDIESFLENADTVCRLLRSGKAAAAYTPTYGGIAEAIMKMCFGNSVGFEFSDEASKEDIFGYNYGSFVLELADGEETGETLGHTVDSGAIAYRGAELRLDELLSVYENKLEPVYACNIKQSEREIPALSYTDGKRSRASVKIAKPRVLIPVFPGTNCEYDVAKRFLKAGALPEIFVINNKTASDIANSVSEFSKLLKNSQIVFIPGGFSGGDEPDGSGKFITAFFRSSEIKDGVHELLKQREGLMAGICNGFQALVKLGLVPFGEIRDMSADAPTLTYNTISRHQSRIVATRIASNLSPWLGMVNVGDIVNVPISHGEGKFMASAEWLERLAANGQIATQYVDAEGSPSCDVRFNPNDSAYAIEGITSPDGRVFGKMGHSERLDDNLYKNVPGNYDVKLFESAVYYFN